MAGGQRAEWVERMREASVLQVARELGFQISEPRGAGGGSVYGCPDPSCGAERRHTTTGDKRGAVGVRSEGKGWHCFQCDATGDALRFVELFIAGRRMGEMSDDDKAKVREWCMGRLGLTTGSSPGYQPPAPILKPAPPAPPPKYLPADELRAFWNACTRMDAADIPPDVFAWMVAKRIDLQAVADMDLARAIPNGIACPSWATYKGAPWPELGYRVVARMADATGHTRGLRARNVLPGAGADAPPKTMAAKGYQSVGLVFACPLARKVLATGEGPAGLVVEIVEGEKKFMQRATLHHANESAHVAVVGIEQGAWSDDLARRLPPKTAVHIRTDVKGERGGAQGAQYASQILRSLDRTRPRDVQIRLRTAHELTTTEDGTRAVRLRREEDRAS